MNTKTIKEQLNVYLAQGKLNFIQLQEMERSIAPKKYMRELNKDERDLILNYIK